MALHGRRSHHQANSCGISLTAMQGCIAKHVRIMKDLTETGSSSSAPSLSAASAFSMAACHTLIANGQPLCTCRAHPISFQADSTAFGSCERRQRQH